MRGFLILSLSGEWAEERVSTETTACTKITKLQGYRNVMVFHQSKNSRNAFSIATECILQFNSTIQKEKEVIGSQKSQSHV